MLKYIFFDKSSLVTCSLNCQGFHYHHSSLPAPGLLGTYQISEDRRPLVINTLKQPT